MSRSNLRTNEEHLTGKCGSGISQLARLLPVDVVAAVCAAASLLTLLYWWTYGLQWLYSAYQFLDHNLLLHDAIRSLLYCHSQPPLLNLLTSLALKAGWITGLSPVLFIAAMLLAIVIASALCAYYWVSLYIQNKLWTIVVVLLYALNPSLYAYASKWFYDPICHALMMIFICGLAAWTRQGSVRGLWLCTAAVAALGLTRSHFSFWFCISLVVLCVIAGVYVRRSNVRAWATPAVVAVTVLTLWPMKNRIVFGRFSGTSWDSYTLARATPLVGYWYGDFLRNMSLHQSAVQQCPYRHPVLLAAEKSLFMGGEGGANWNHYKLLLMLDPYVKAGIKWRLDHPREWVAHAVFFYTKATMHDCKLMLDQTPKRSGSLLWRILDIPNRYLIYLDVTHLLPDSARDYLERQKEELVQWLSADEWVPVQVTLFGLVIQPSLFILAAYFLVRGSREERAVALIYLWVIAYMYATTILTDGNEGYRMLFSVKGMHLFLILCVMARLRGEQTQSQKEKVAA